MRILFTCGGTGGHIYPAIAMYNEFKNRNEDIEFLFVGSDYGLEKEIMKNEGIHMEFIKSRGIKRSLSLSNMKSALYNLIAFFQAKEIISKFKPDLVISTGAYPTFHITYFSVRKKIPVFLIESNIIPGFVTKLFSDKAQKVFISSKTTLSYLKDPLKAEVVGTPSRIVETIKTIDQISKELCLSNKEKIVTIVGGSCGALKLNDSIIEMVNNREISCQILWATGKNNYNYVLEHLKNMNNKVKVIDYINNMNEVLKITDLIICRAGAMTIEEIKEFSIPAIIIPFEQATDNHQYINALELEKAGSAVILEEKDVAGDILHEKINTLVNNDKKLELMKKNYEKIKTVNSNKKIYESIMKEMG